MIAYRDGKTLAYRWQLVLLASGMSCYVGAVVAYLLAM
jgi:hypothetical protein